MYDLIIIGGGPGGAAAAVYAARKKIKTLVITDTFGGQSLVSADVQNWIGTKSVTGLEFAKMLEEHVKSQEDIEVLEGDLVTLVSKKNEGFEVKTQNGKTFEAKYFLVTSGSRRRRLNIPGEKEWEGKGVAYCSICDAPIFKNKIVAVVGGGNAGVEACVDLLPYASKIYLMDRNDSVKGDPVTFEKVKNSGKLTLILGSEPQKILGEKFVSGLEYKDLKTGEVKTLPLQGLFVEIGAVPNSDFVKGLVELNRLGEIVVNHKTMATSLHGIWAVGDVTDVLYKQNNISAGDAVKAVLNIYAELNRT